MYVPPANPSDNPEPRVWAEKAGYSTGLRYCTPRTYQSEDALCLAEWDR